MGRKESFALLPRLSRVVRALQSPKILAQKAVEEEVMPQEKKPELQLRRTEMPDLFGGDEKKARPASVTIQATPKEAYALFRKFSQLPRFMRHLREVEEVSSSLSKWFSDKGEAWETEIIEDRAGKLIAWRSKPGSMFEQAAAVTFEPSIKPGTCIVSFKLAYKNTAGKIAGAAEKILGVAGKFEERADPDTEAAITLRRFKALLETGEVPTTKGQPSGREEGEADEGSMLAG